MDWKQLEGRSGFLAGNPRPRTGCQVWDGHWGVCWRREPGSPGARVESGGHLGSLGLGSPQHRPQSGPHPQGPPICSLNPLTLHLLTWSLTVSPLCGSQAKHIWGLVCFFSYFRMSQSLQRFNHFSPMNGWQGAGAQLSAPG